jgi:hypothetical protein
MYSLSITGRALWADNCPARALCRLTITPATLLDSSAKPNNVEGCQTADCRSPPFCSSLR